MDQENHSRGIATVETTAGPLPSYLHYSETEPGGEWPGEEIVPSIVVEGETVILENGAELPVQFCVKSGKPCHRTVRKALRDPRNPLTWFGGRPRITVGLSRRHHENRLVALTLTWSFFAVGLIMLAVGFAGGDPFAGGTGAFLILISGVFRASYPVWSPAADEGRVEVRGTGEDFRRRLLELAATVEVLDGEPAE